MVDNKNNHYVPQFYLKYWANNRNKVWFYNINQEASNKKPNPGQTHVKHICSEDYLYWIGQNTAIEFWAKRKVEDICGDVFKKIKGKLNITEKDITYTKAFLALTMARHPLLKKSSEQISQALVPDGKIQNPLAQTVRWRFKHNLLELAPLNLQILCIPDEIDDTFITSDVPFVWVAINDENNDEQLKDYSKVKSFYWFPISPKRLGFLSENVLDSFYDDISDTDRIMKINCEIALWAHDMIVATNLEILNFLKKLF